MLYEHVALCHWWYYKTMVVAPTVAATTPTRICVDATPTMDIAATMVVATPTRIHVDATPTMVVAAPTMIVVATMDVFKGHFFMFYNERSIHKLLQNKLYQF